MFSSVLVRSYLVDLLSCLGYSARSSFHIFTVGHVLRLIAVVWTIVGLALRIALRLLLAAQPSKISGRIRSFAAVPFAPDTASLLLVLLALQAPFAVDCYLQPSAVLLAR